MTAIAWLFETGHVVDVALAFVALEAIALWLLRTRLPPNLSLPCLYANIASGALLLVALRAALTGAHWIGVAVPMTGALVAHVVDLASRLSRSGKD